MKSVRDRTQIAGLVASICLLLAAPGWCGEKQKPDPLPSVSVPAEYQKDFEAAMQLPVTNKIERKERSKALRVIAMAWSKKDPIAAFLWGDYILGGGTILEHSKDNDEAEWQPLLYAIGDIGSDPVRAKKLAEYIISPEYAKMSAVTPPKHKLIKLNFSWAISDPEACATFAVNSPLDCRFEAIGSAFNTWVRNKKAPAGAAMDWMLKLDSEKERYCAIMGLAPGISDLASATEWIKKLRPEEVKMAATLVYQSHKKDADKAKEWLAGLSLSKEDMESVLNSPPLYKWTSDYYTRTENKTTPGK